MKTWVSVLTAAVVLIGVACVNLYIPFIKFDGDNAGTFISALGVLVTALVGWQIYNAIEMRTVIREHDRLSHQLTQSSNLLADQDRRNIELTEAFHCVHVADLHNIDSITHQTARYIALMRASLHFIRANVPSDYATFASVRNDLTRILERIGQIDTSARSQFNNFRETYDNIYNEIITALNRRISEFSELRQFINETHARRVMLHE